MARKLIIVDNFIPARSKEKRFIIGKQRIWYGTAIIFISLKKVIARSLVAAHLAATNLYAYSHCAIDCGSRK